MAPSRRKSATSTFKQAWHETDAASFDPSSLPVSKAPRAWERKSETSKSRGGKEKKVWRRYTTRSTVANTAASEEDEAETEDARSRPVKKLQCVRPGEMEQTASMLKGKKRAYKATRFDRRKSVLPSE
jgi:hypothetical protein